MTQIGLMAGSI